MPHHAPPTTWYYGNAKFEDAQSAIFVIKLTEEIHKNDIISDYVCFLCHFFNIHVGESSLLEKKSGIIFVGLV